METSKYYLTRPDDDDGLVHLTPMCREYNHHRGLRDPRCFATITVNTKMGPVLNIHISGLFGICNGIEVQIPSPNKPNYSSWLLICRGLERFVDELLNQRSDPEHVVTAPELFCSGSLVHGRQDSENNVRDRDHVCTQLTGAHRKHLEFMVHLSEVNLRARETGTRVYSKKEVPMPERNWITILAALPYMMDSLSSNIWKTVTRKVRHHDQDERERDGAVRWDTMYPIPWKEFQGKIGRRCTQEEWIDYIHLGSNKTRCEYCLYSRKELNQ